MKTGETTIAGLDAGPVLFTGSRYGLCIIIPENHLHILLPAQTSLRLAQTSGTSPFRYQQTRALTLSRLIVMLWPLLLTLRQWTLTLRLLVVTLQCHRPHPQRVVYRLTTCHHVAIQLGTSIQCELEHNS